MNLEPCDLAPDGGRLKLLDLVYPLRDVISGRRLDSQDWVPDLNGDDVDEAIEILPNPGESVPPLHDLSEPPFAPKESEAALGW
jgi:hypothetical protein